MKNNLIRKYGYRFLNRLKAKGIVDIPIANSRICNDQWTSNEIKQILLRTSLNGNSKSIRDRSHGKCSHLTYNSQKIGKR